MSGAGGAGGGGGGKPRSDARLERVFRVGSFAVTSEVVPPRSGSVAGVADQARALVGYADAANVTDNPTASAHMSPVAGAAAVAAAGLEPIVQLTARDRNRLALTSDLLGAWALGARAVLCLSGDRPADAAGAPVAVNDVTITELVALVRRLRDEGRIFSGEEVEEPPRFLVGVADSPLAEPYDVGRLEAKLDAGADFVQTQIVFDLDAFAAWADLARARGVLERAFVLVGVGIARSAASARFMRDHLHGVSVPDAVIGRLEAAGPGEDEEGVRIAAETVGAIRRIEGIAGVHLMGIGRQEPVRRVVVAAGLYPRRPAAPPPR